MFRIHGQRWLSYLINKLQWETDHANYMQSHLTIVIISKLLKYFGAFLYKVFQVIKVPFKV